MKEHIRNLIEHLKDESGLLSAKEATVGFDGFVDNIVRVVKNKQNYQDVFFDSMAELGNYILNRQGKSCSLELKEQVVKIGGNMPILSNALASLGVKVNCLGCMGSPEIIPMFKSMHPNCTLFSVADPCHTTALEFDDGKIMMADMHLLDDVGWENIKDILGLPHITRLFNDSDLLGIVNWSEMRQSNAIWKGVLQEVLPYHIKNKKQVVCFDLSDCSKKEKGEVMLALNYIEQFAKHYKVILSLNENEARHICRELCETVHEGDMMHIGEYLYGTLHIDMLVIHPVEFSMAWDGSGTYRFANFMIKSPKLSTGGGDNFNAGFNAAQLLELDTISSLVLASAAASAYIKYGYSLTMTPLLNYLEEVCEAY